MVRTRTVLHDENYKRLFASPLMVRDVLRVCLPAHRLAAADLPSLGKLSAEYVSDELRTRHGDTGVDQQRALLCRLAAARFDAETAARLAELAADRPRVLARLVDEQVSEARHPGPVAHGVGEQLGELGGVAPASRPLVEDQGDDGAQAPLAGKLLTGAVPDAAAVLEQPEAYPAIGPGLVV